MGSASNNKNCLGLSLIELINREVDFVDIAYDEISAKHYKAEEDPKYFQSERTGRGPLMVEDWRDTLQPIMCPHKLVHPSFEVGDIQARVQDSTRRFMEDILLLGHRQAYDKWYDMILEKIRQYIELKTQAEKIRLKNEFNEEQTTSTPSSSVSAGPCEEKIRAPGA